MLVWMFSNAMFDACLNYDDLNVNACLNVFTCLIMRCVWMLMYFLDCTQFICTQIFWVVLFFGLNCSLRRFMLTDIMNCNGRKFMHTDILNCTGRKFMHYKHLLGESQWCFASISRGLGRCGGAIRRTTEEIQAHVPLWKVLFSWIIC